MARYILQRLAGLIPVVIGLSLIVFLLMAMIPGNPAQALLGAYATPENVSRISQELGLDKPLWQQYLIWIGNLLHGDFGRSFVLNRPVLDEVLERFFATLLLGGCALLLSVVLGLLAGVTAAVRQFGWGDRIITLLVLLGISLPSFLIGLLMIMLFAVSLRWFPASGMLAVYGGGGIGDLLHHLAMPVVALALVATGVIARLTRTVMLEVLRQDYIRTARAKGVSERRVVWRHAFRVALVAVVPAIGIQASFVLGGAVYIETVFQWPGLGAMLVKAVSTRDLLLVQGGVLVAAVACVLINLVTDIVQAWLDPRIKS